MKVNNYILYTLLAVASMLSSCSENLFEPTNGSGKEVTLNLSYSDDTPKQVTLTRATEAEERHLDNLYIYVFDANGRLKGFKAIEGEGNLDQETSNTHRGSVQVKTLSGSSYIFAVANISTGLYPVETGHGDGQLPIDFNETDVQKGLETEFTMQKFLNLPFVRNNSATLQISSSFLLSGSCNNGNAVDISTAGAVTGGDDANVIKLRRVVAKIRFNIGVKSDDGVTRTFSPSSYTVVNAAMRGPLVSGKQSSANQVYVTTQSSDNFSTNTANFNPNYVENSKNYFEVYIPANEQTALKELPAGSDQAMREDDSQSDPKVFTYAPKYGTYLMIKGEYSEVATGRNYSAETTYYVHLGDFNTDINDYSVERNYAYTYNVTVAGVSKIIVEAQKEGNTQPAAEGDVLDISTGRNFNLDSHYEDCVMRFYQKDAQNLYTETGRSFMFQVRALGGKTSLCYYDASGFHGDYNGVDPSWIEFVAGGTYATSSTGTRAGRGTPVDYPGKGASTIYNIKDFVKLLYDNVNSTSFWTGGYGSNKYIDVTCFLDENYYPDLTWDKYTNNAGARSFYLADDIDISTDDRSSYAKVVYGVHQYAIQTVYNADKASSVVAYGCETINNEEEFGTNTTYLGTHATVSAPTNGQDAFYQQFAPTTSGYYRPTTTYKKWSSYSSYSSSSSSSSRYFRTACISRNRDLNGDGNIDADEVRWYTPTLSQVSGLWLGESVLSTQSRLFNGSTANLTYGSNNYRKIYFTATAAASAYFSEEGMATGYAETGDWKPQNLKCVRTLKSNDDGAGYATQPDDYYTVSGNTVDMSNMDKDALNITGEQGELQSHNERDEADKIASKFTIATSNLTSSSSYYSRNITVANVVDGTVKCSNLYSQDSKTWRVPNHRELMVMVLVKGMSNLAGCVSRTLFSNQSFRYTWYINSNNVQLLDPSTNTSAIPSYAYIRCISVEQ